MLLRHKVLLQIEGGCLVNGMIRYGNLLLSADRNVIDYQM
jgi:hypothetical protein